MWVLVIARERRGDDLFPHFKRRSVDFGRRPNLGATTYSHTSKGEVWVLDVAPNWGRRPFSTLQKEKCGFCACTFKVFLAIRVHFRTSKGELWVFECRPDVVDPADHVNAVYVAHRRRGRSCQCYVLCTCPTTPISGAAVAPKTPQ